MSKPCTIGLIIYALVGQKWLKILYIQKKIEFEFYNNILINSINNITL